MTDTLTPGLELDLQIERTLFGGAVKPPVARYSTKGAACLLVWSWLEKRGWHQHRNAWVPGRPGVFLLTIEHASGFIVMVEGRSAEHAACLAALQVAGLQAIDDAADVGAL